MTCVCFRIVVAGRKCHRVKPCSTVGMGPLLLMDDSCVPNSWEEQYLAQCNHLTLIMKTATWTPKVGRCPACFASWASVPRIGCAPPKSSAVLSQSCQLGRGALKPCRAPQIRTPCLSAAVIAVPHQSCPTCFAQCVQSPHAWWGECPPPRGHGRADRPLSTRPCQSPASQRPARFALVALLRQLDRNVRHASQLADYMLSSPRQVPLCASQAPCFASLYS